MNAISNYINSEVSFLQLPQYFLRVLVEGERRASKRSEVGLGEHVLKQSEQTSRRTKEQERAWHWVSSTNTNLLQGVGQGSLRDNSDLET